MNAINLRGVRTLLVRAAAVSAIGVATLTGSAAIASAQTQPTQQTVPLITCVLHTQNRGVVFSQMTYGDCFQLMYASPLNRRDSTHPASTGGTLPTHPTKWTGGHVHSTSDQG